MGPAQGQGRSDLDEAGLAQAEGRVLGHGVPLDLVPVQAQHLQLGEVYDVHHGAEAADGELCGDKRGAGGWEEPASGSRVRSEAWEAAWRQSWSLAGGPRGALGWGVIPTPITRGHKSGASAVSAAPASYPPRAGQHFADPGMPLSVLATRT